MAHFIRIGPGSGLSVTVCVFAQAADPGPTPPNQGSLLPGLKRYIKIWFIVVYFRYCWISVIGLNWRVGVAASWWPWKSQTRNAK